MFLKITGCYNPSRKRDINYQTTTGRDSKFYKTDKVQHITFPCGRCPQCVKKHVSQWSFRLMQSFNKSKSAHFVTLTYNNENLPFTATYKETLYKPDVTAFIKRLRTNLQREAQKTNSEYVPIKYYLVGEYGGLKGRPHYHMIILNASEDQIIKAWGKGNIHFGNAIHENSIGYLLKYINKPAFNKTTHKRYTREVEVYSKPSFEFRNMSKGIGQEYINWWSFNWHNEDLTGRYYVPLSTEKGIVKISMPRYYANHFYDPEDHEIIQRHIFKKINHQWDEALKEYTPQQIFSYMQQVIQNENIKQSKKFKPVYSDGQ